MTGLAARAGTDRPDVFHLNGGPPQYGTDPSCLTGEEHRPGWVVLGEADRAVVHDGAADRHGLDLVVGGPCHVADTETGEPTPWVGQTRQWRKRGGKIDGPAAPASERRSRLEASDALEVPELRVTSVSRCSSAVAAISASGNRRELARRSRPARSATAVSTGSSFIGSSRRRTRRFLYRDLRIAPRAR